MIGVKKYDQMCQDIIQAIPEFKGYVITSTEEQTTKKIKDRPGIQLVAIYPAYRFIGDQDSYRVEHDILFFVILKPKEGAKYEVELQENADTQDALIKLKKFLFGEGDDLRRCKLLPHLNVNSVIIDPEYNIFGGFSGWSIKLTC